MQTDNFTEVRAGPQAIERVNFEDERPDTLTLVSPPAAAVAIEAVKGLISRKVQTGSQEKEVT